jgi:hypothetical protein
MYVETHSPQPQFPHNVARVHDELEFWASVSEEDLAYWSDYKITGLGEFYVEFSAD